MKYFIIAFNFIVCFSSIAQTPTCIWATREGATGYDWANSIAVDKSGSNSLYVTGPFTSDSITIGPSTIYNAQPGIMDFMLIKFDSNGIPIWATAAGSNSDDYVSCVTADNQGNAYVTGAFSGSSISFGSTTVSNTVAGSNEGFLVKYDSSGTFQWVIIAAGTLHEYIGYMKPDHAGNIYLTGSFSSDSLVLGAYTIYNNGPGSSNEKFMVKVDAGGTVLWAIETGASGPITVDNLGNIFMCGNMNDSLIVIGSDTLLNNGAGSNDVFIAKFDATGSPIWAKSAGGLGNDGCYAIATDNSGNVCITGNYWGPSITFAPYTLFHSGGWGMYLVKYDTDGNVLWAEGSGGSGGNCAGHGIAIDSSGIIFVTGTFGSSPVSFGPANLTSSGLWDIFLTTFESDGNPVWAISAGGTDYDYTNALAMDEIGNVYIGGAFHSGAATFNPFTLTSAGHSDLFLVKYSNINTSVNEDFDSSFITVSPNPFNSLLTIAIHQNVKQASFILRNSLGQELFKIHEKNINGIYSKSFDLGEIANGIYLLQANFDGEQSIRKIIKE